MAIIIFGGRKNATGHQKVLIWAQQYQQGEVLSLSFSETLWGEAKMLLNHLAPHMFLLPVDLDYHLKPVEKLELM